MSLRKEETIHLKEFKTFHGEDERWANLKNNKILIDKSE